MVQKLNEIFKKGSITYYNSSYFFPPKVREDVTKLYAFVRVFDDLVDSVPQKVEEFYNLRKLYYLEKSGYDTRNIVLQNFVELSMRKGFDDSWVEAFLNAMESDIYKKVYYTIDELLKYMYGSAEVVGLFMMKILDLPSESMHYARMLGRAMQFLNFLRDIQEDLYLGRQYLPVEDMEKFGIDRMECNEAFKGFIRYEINRYFEFEMEAEEGFRYIPARYLVPIKTASEMYKWTALRIRKFPCIVLSKKIKPRRRKIVVTAIKNFAGVYLWRFLNLIM
ncbi:MAG: phytoene/squalene synthase family protein [Saccharolobus sp.]|uniref:Phytoene synthase n=5 Tax=Saccharolobus TaxID=2100760 RepID=A0A8F5GTR3_SACSH|nr:phytoene/squalene synthase family protein [Saccharolobus shibatae]MCH4814725.1 phytoene/squalene synthase family protein [Saccharolobus shibatae]QXJ29218.1 Phytoene synthase [Saccharolobus shibatae B12]QXJ32462.1 Phytoene synthase [Saccharolobus shibatae]